MKKNKIINYILGNNIENPLMVYTDSPAITYAIDPRVQDMPKVLHALSNYELRHRLSPDQYMSLKLVNEFLLKVDFTNKDNRKDFEGFAHELLSWKCRGDKYEVNNYGKTFILYNCSKDYSYRVTFQ